MSSRRTVTRPLQIFWPLTFLVEGQPSVEREILLSDIVEAEVKESLTFPIIATSVLLVSVGLIVLYNSVRASQ